MKIDLIEFLRDNDIKIVNKILDKRNGLCCVGYHLHSPSMKEHDNCIFNLTRYMLNNGRNYNITDGAETIKTRNDIYLHLI